MYKCVCTWFCSKANSEGGHMVHSPAAFTPSTVKMKGGIQLSQSVIRKLGTTSNPARGRKSHLRGIIHPICFGQVLGWLSHCLEVPDSKNCIQAEKVGLTSKTNPEHSDSCWSQKELNCFSPSPRVL